MRAFHGKQAKPPKLTKEDDALRSRMQVSFEEPNTEPSIRHSVGDDGVIHVVIVGVNDGDALSDEQQEMVLAALEVVKQTKPEVLITCCKGGNNRSCLMKILAQIAAGQVPDAWTGHNSYFQAIVQLAEETKDVKKALREAVKPTSLRKRTRPE